MHHAKAKHDKISILLVHHYLQKSVEFLRNINQKNQIRLSIIHRLTKSYSLTVWDGFVRNKILSPVLCRARFSHVEDRLS